MGRTLGRHCKDARTSERIPLYARLQLTTEDGKPIVPFARCTNIGMGGLQVTASEGLAPGTTVHVALEMPKGRSFEVVGHVAWSKQTIHPSLFGSTASCDDDAAFGIAFEDLSAEATLPIARLFSGRDRERAKAHRIRRIYGIPSHA